MGEDEHRQPGDYFCEVCDEDEHEVTLQAIGKGEEIWKRRIEAGDASSRISEILTTPQVLVKWTVRIPQTPKGLSDSDEDLAHWVLVAVTMKREGGPSLCKALAAVDHNRLLLLGRDLDKVADVPEEVVIRAVREAQWVLNRPDPEVDNDLRDMIKASFRTDHQTNGHHVPDDEPD